MNLELRLESCALREQILGSMESIINVQIRVVAADPARKILSALSGLLATLIGHSQIDGVENLVAELLRRFRKLIGESSNSLHVRDDFLVALLDGLYHESAHTIHDSGCGA